MPDAVLVGVVGPCGSGKSTLISTLRARQDLEGVILRHIAQEHSYVPSMWQRITRPHLLIFLDASYAETVRRRQLNWSEGEYAEQQRRLAHARAHAHLYLMTDALSIDQVVEAVLNFLRDQGVTSLPDDDRRADLSPFV